MAARAVGWLARKGLMARTVTLKVRYSNFDTITRSHTAKPSRDRTNLVQRALALLDRTDAGRRPVRLLGVSVHNLSGEAAQANDPNALPFPEAPGPEGSE
jgi:DNA polymerase-4